MNQSSQLLSQRLNNSNSSSMYGYLSDTMLAPSQTYFISLLTQPLRVTAQVKDQAQRRLPRSNRAVFKPRCSASSNPVSTSIPPWTHKDQNSKTSDLPISPRCKTSGCSFTQTVGRQRRRARTPTGAGSTSGISPLLLLKTALGVGSCLALY